MRRIVVVGPPCAGKTTAAAAIAKRLGLPHIELDGLWWEPNWTEAGPELFQARLRDVVSQPEWVVDGNYLAVGGREIIYPAADTSCGWISPVGSPCRAVLAEPCIE